MNKFAKIKFVQKQDDHGQVVVEGQAWDEITSVRCMASPDYRELGFGDSVESAKKDAARNLQEAHRKFMMA